MSVNRFARYMIGVVLSLAMSSAVHAAVIYQQDVLQVGSFGFLSNTFGDETADNFSLGGASEVTSLRWYGSYSGAIGGNTDTFLLSIFGDTAFSSEVFSVSTTAATRIDSGFTNDFGAIIYEYNYALASALTLGGGEYLLSVSNANSAFEDWFWADSLDQPPGDGVIYYNDVSEWVADGSFQTDVAFTIFGDRIISVPLPSTVLLIFAGLFGLLLAHRRRV